jgi:hypothetical protein
MTQALFRDKFGAQVFRREVEDEERNEIVVDNQIYDRVGVEDHEIIFVARCNTCGKAGHEPDCYELQHTGAN